jgi:hypothetical protein
MGPLRCPEPVSGVVAQHGSSGAACGGMTAVCRCGLKIGGERTPFACWAVVVHSKETGRRRSDSAVIIDCERVASCRDRMGECERGPLKLFVEAY